MALTEWLTCWPLCRINSREKKVVSGQYSVASGQWPVVS